MKMLIRKAMASFAWFLAFCAVLAFFGGIAAYILSDGASPEERGQASELLVESWGNAYFAAIMALAAVLTILGMLTRKLPGLRMAEKERSGSAPP